MELALLLAAIIGIEESVGGEGFLFENPFNSLDGARPSLWGAEGSDDHEVDWEPGWEPEAMRREAMRGAGAQLLERALCVPLPAEHIFWIELPPHATGASRRDAARSRSSRGSAADPPTWSGDYAGCSDSRPRSHWLVIPIACGLASGGPCCTSPACSRVFAHRTPRQRPS